MNNNDIEISIIRSKLENLIPYISLSAIAGDYFGKTRQWFYQRLNESKVNGKTIKFTQKELVILSNALYEIGRKMQDVSKTVLNNELLSNKKIKSLILDMDLTLIDREHVGNYDYKNETIQKYCKNVPKFTMYEGWNEVFTFIRNNHIKVCIVSDAHETIIKNVISHFNIPCDYIVGHQSAKGKKKPNSFPMIEALRLMDEVPENVLSFGDSLNDFKSATGASIKHYACVWGSNDEGLLKENGCKNFIDYPKQIIEVLEK
jgi:phosphoglycolate phosphatase-like HAD superfamily hydrolase